MTTANITSLADLQTMRDNVIAAINSILTNGQAVGHGGRNMTRADLKELREMRSDLDREIAARERGGISWTQGAPKW